MLNEDVGFSDKKESSNNLVIKSKSLFIEAHADDAITIEDK